MSEYQYYEFVAVDRPLTDGEQAEVRSTSTRARITATSFVNEYHWGEFSGDTSLLMERYYDAHLYVAEWGTHRVMVRVPGDLLDLDVVDDFQVDERLDAWATRTSVVLDFISEDDAGEFDLDADPETWLSAMVGVRAELAVGDLRSLYLGWLAGYGAWEREESLFDRSADDDLEPPVPSGLKSLSGAQRALADFLRLDGDLLAVAAEMSDPIEPAGDGPGGLGAWVAGLSVVEKDRLLVRVAQGEDARVRWELLRRFGDENAPTTCVAPRRTVAELLDGAAGRRTERRRRARTPSREGSG